MLETIMVAQLWSRPWLPSRLRRLVRKQLSRARVEYLGPKLCLRQERQRNARS